MQGPGHKDGKMLARKLEAYANNGGYASHGHAICANCGNVFKDIYQDRLGAEIDCYTVWTSTATAGGHEGIRYSQAAFLSGMPYGRCVPGNRRRPLAFRMENCMGEGFVDPANGITFHSYGLKKCMEEGAKYIGWEEKRRAYANQTGPVRKGEWEWLSSVIRQGYIPFHWSCLRQDDTESGRLHSASAGSHRNRTGR